MSFVGGRLREALADSCCAAPMAAMEEDAPAADAPAAIGPTEPPDDGLVWCFKGLGGFN